MATIKAIEGRSVHQIQSGQVIVDLISVVKELVENSLDAGATSIEIRFKNHGLDSIEVQDNGKGIAPEDFASIALKHHTSKLSSYEDLTSLATFGFRGEALSSLCALSKFYIVTARADDGAVGRRLEFETSGALKSNSVVAAQKGTSVSVENLFHNLPVRRKELEKNIKREYGKVLVHLHAYACISVGVRFAVTNQMPKGNKAPVFSTKANTTTKENITNVFGAKTLPALVKLDLSLEMEPSKGPSTQGARSWSTQASDHSRAVKVQGYISKPIFGEGRQAPDRQMFFVNSRPCGLPQVSKAVNEVYKSFNVSQSPFVFANLIMNTNSYDVNVSPDKRSIMLHDQTALLESFKESLTELFEQTDHTMPQSQLPDRKLPSYKPLTMPPRGRNIEDSTTPAHEDPDSDEEAESVSLNEAAGHSAAPQRPVKQFSASLIESWTGRDTEDRHDTPIKSVEREKVARLNEPPPQGARACTSEIASHWPIAETAEERTEVATSILGDEGANDDSSVDGELQSPHQIKSNVLKEPDPMGSPFDDLFSQRPPRPPNTIENHVNQDHDGLTDSTPRPQRSAQTQPSEESDITNITPSQKAAPGPVQSAFDRMRPMRTTLQTAEITIGDKTTTAVIGSSPPYKRRRIHQPQNSQTIAQFGGSPLLARGLRNFAAPGSQMEIDRGRAPFVSTPAPLRTQSSENDEDDDEDDGVMKGGRDGHDYSDVITNRQVPVISNGSDHPPADSLDALLPAPADDDEFDEDYVDDEERKTREDEKVARLIQEAELATAEPSEANLRRASQVVKNGGGRKDTTVQLAQYIDSTIDDIRKMADAVAVSNPSRRTNEGANGNAVVKDEIDDTNAESKLSLTVSKSDFARMSIIGQFNLGFILAIRPASGEGDEDQLFIIDQHAADEKYNYERLGRTVTLQNQRLVRPKALELTAIEEEIILNHGDALKANGFDIEVISDVAEDDGEADDGTARRRCRLITLPISGEKTFDLSDLEELLHLLSEAPASSSEIPRPKKVQKMLAMRACRSSIMVGRTLTLKQMVKVVRHMGEMEKPWNCPHGRPTMRHLAGLGKWSGWLEGDSLDDDEDGSGHEFGSRSTDWGGWLRRHE